MPASFENRALPGLHLDDDRVREIFALAITQQPSLVESSTDVVDELVAESTNQWAGLLWSDLNSSILASSGPVSFSRFAEAEADECQLLKGYSFVKALDEAALAQSCVEALARYGRVLAGAGLPKQTRVFGAVLLACATVKLCQRCQSSIDDDQSEAINDLFRRIVDQAGSCENLQSYLKSVVLRAPSRQ
jgi:hypothetical protein